MNYQKTRTILTTDAQKIANGFASVKLGTIEFRQQELRETIQAGKPWILTRECAYFVAGESCERGTFLYRKIPTVSKRNTLPHRFFLMSWEQVSAFIANDRKAWKVVFDNENAAAENEYNVRENTMVNTYLEGNTLWMDSSEVKDKFVKDWFWSAAELEPVEPERHKSMFHPMWG